jgi:protocatechuate 3,4-dioxygenase beta subunit
MRRSGITFKGIVVLAAVCGLLFATVVPAFSANPPVAGSPVSASLKQSGIGGSSTYSDANGGYSIYGNILPGPYSVNAHPYGYIGSSQDVTIASLIDNVTVNFQLNRSAVVTGKLIGYDGSPVVGAYVSLKVNGSGAYVGNVLSDSTGTYVFADGIPTGNFYIDTSFTFPFSGPAIASYYGGNFTGLPTSGWWDAPYLDTGYIHGNSSAFATTAGQLTQVPIITLARSGVVVGTVKDGLGNPVANATVVCWNTAFFIMVLSDNAGNYRVSYELGNGTYFLRAHKAGLVGTTVNFTAAQGQTSTIDLAMGASAGVYGYVMRGDGRSVPKATVSFTLADAGGYYYVYAVSNDTGYYSLTAGMITGNYSVTVSFGAGSFSSYVSLTAGTQTSCNPAVDFYLVNGTVLKENTTGQALPSASVSLSFGQAGWGASATGGADGKYTMYVPIAPGTKGTFPTANVTFTATGYDSKRATLTVAIGQDTIVDAFLKSYATGGSATIHGTISGSDGPDLPPTFSWYHCASMNYTFLVGVNSTSWVAWVSPSLPLRQLYFYIKGPEGTQGTMTVWVPDSIYQRPFTASWGWPGQPSIVSQVDNGTYTAVTITYANHDQTAIYLYSTTAIPEFPGVILPLTAFGGVLLAVLAERRLRPKASP